MASGSDDPAVVAEMSLNWIRRRFSFIGCNGRQILAAEWRGGRRCATFRRLQSNISAGSSGDHRSPIPLRPSELFKGRRGAFSHLHVSVERACP